MSSARAASRAGTAARTVAGSARRILLALLLSLRSSLLLARPFSSSWHSICSPPRPLLLARTSSLATAARLSREHSRGYRLPPTGRLPPPLPLHCRHPCFGFGQPSITSKLASMYLITYLRASSTDLGHIQDRPRPRAVSLDPPLLHESPLAANLRRVDRGYGLRPH